MIASLAGAAVARDERSCIIDVGGVGYLVQASQRTIASLPAPPAVARVLVETQLRDDTIALYGFADESERAWFRLLIGVQGVGAKLALGVLSAFSTAELGAAVIAGDATALTRASGVGSRLAKRLVSELARPAAALHPGESGAAPSALPEEAVSALVNLGYRQAEAEAALARAGARLGSAAALPNLIREGLRELAR